MKIIPSVGSLSTPEDKAVFINAVRKFLTRDLADLPDEAYAWQPVVTAYPIGRSLLHIAAFEHISISAAIGKPIDSELWEHIKIGVERMVELPPSRATYYSEILDAVRTLTIQALPELNGHIRPDFHSAFENLDLDSDSYDLYVREIIGADAETPSPHDGEYDVSLDAEAVVQNLVVHEAYHRGTVTFIKHLYSLAQTERLDIAPELERFATASYN